MRVSSRHAGAVALGILLVLVIALPALAHADLVSSTPEDGAVLEAPPTSVTLTFSEGLDAGKSSVRLTGPDGLVDAGKPAKDGATTMGLTGLDLGPGDYSVKWVAAADDGHIERGTLGFTVTQPTPPPASSSPTPAASPEATASPVSGTATPAATTAPTQPAAATPSPPTASPVAQPEPVAADASGTDVLLPIALGLVLVAGVGLFVLRRSRNA